MSGSSYPSHHRDPEVDRHLIERRLRATVDGDLDWESAIVELAQEGHAGALEALREELSTDHGDDLG